MASTLASQRSDNSVRGKRTNKTDENVPSNAANKVSLKTFEPTRKKLTSVESQRLINSIDECIDKMEIATLIPEVVLPDMDRFRTMLGHQSVEALQEQSFLMHKFHEQRLQVAEMYERQKNIARDIFPWAAQGLDGTPSGERIIASLRGVESQLRAAIRKATRRLTRGDHGAVASIKKAGVDESAASGEVALRNKQQQQQQLLKHQQRWAVRRVIESVSVLRQILFERFLTSPMEDEERHQFLREVSIRDKKNVVIMEKLDKELAAAIADKEVEVSKRNDVIRRLQIELNNVEKTHEENVRRTKIEAEKQENADIKNSEGKKQKLLHEIAQLKAQVTTITAEHRESEVTMRKRKFKAETEVENLIQKYDEDIGEKQTELDELSGVYAEERSQLLQLEDRFNKLEGEYLQIMEERRIEKEKREAEEALRLVQNKAAISIQAYWRSFKCRKMLKGKKKKGKSKSSRKKDK